MMQLFPPLPTSRLRAIRFLAALGLGTAVIASCGVDHSGLGSMMFLPHDASAGDVAGNPGSAGAAGNVATGAGGTNAAGGTGGVSATGIGGTTIGPAGTGGGSATAGTNGAAGTTSEAGTSGGAGTSGAAGTTGEAGTSGGAGTSGVAGTSGATGAGGIAGTSGVAGTSGLAGTGGLAGTSGVAGAGGIAGGGRGGTGFAGRGGSGGTPTCTPTNCSDGCCNGNLCVRQRTSFLCGAQGAACTACGLCQTCSAMGQCRIDSASRWTIKAVSAQLNGGGWDRNIGEVGGQLPDPFCEFENPAGQVTTTTAGVTDTITDDASPTWNQVITPAGMTVSAATLMAANPTWQIWVGDDDGCNPTGCFADTACTIRQQITEAQLISGELVINNRQMCTRLTLDFLCQATAASGP